jgi:hypothetical protein
MTTALVTPTMDAGVIERVLIHGDLRQLSPAQKVSYYNAVCSSVGLNPLTQPFQYLVLSGKEVLYARRDATEQLRKIHSVSIQITAREVTEDCYIVTARATLPSGRQDENIGAVPIMNLKGEALANAMMKAETKAKRRVTLAICGLGMLDETEVESIQDKPSYVVEAPALTVGRENQAAATGEDRSTSDPVPDLPPGARRIVRVGPGKASAAGEITFDNGESFLTWKKPIVALAEQWCQDGTPCAPELKRSASGNWRIESLAAHALMSSEDLARTTWTDEELADQEL